MNKKKKIATILYVIVATAMIITMFLLATKHDDDEPAWLSYTFPDVCTISVPSTMEVRDDNSIVGVLFDAAHNSNIFKLMCDECDLFWNKSKIVFQPTGMNSYDRQEVADALSTHARILIDFAYNEGLGQYDIKNMTRADLREYNEIVGAKYKSEYECMDGYMNKETTFIWHPVKKLKINDKYCLALEYDRSGLKGMVKVKKYIFLFDGKEIDVTMSYRISDKDKYEKDFKKVIKSFKLISGYMV